MTRTIAAAVALCLSGVSPAPATPQDTAPAQTASPRPATAPVAAPVAADEVAGSPWVGFTLTPANHLRFRMTVDGVSADAILDTGLSHTVIARSFARRAGLAPAERGTVTAVALGGSVPVEWVRTRSLSFGGQARSDARLAMIDLPPLLASASAPTDVLVGADLLRDYALDIDFAAGRFRLLPSGRMPFAGTRLPLRLQEGSGVYLSEVTLRRRRIRPVLVDTGDGSSLTVTQDEWRRAAPANDGVTSTVGYGVGGTVPAGLSVTGDVRLGTIAPGLLEVRIEPDAGFARLTRTAGRIGTGMLRRHRVLLDPKAGLMLLAPTGAPDAAPLRSTSGLLLGYDRARLRVLHVMANSPAARAGWHTDELICAVDGTAVRLANGTVDARWTADAPGRTVRLTMCDGTERALTLARFY